MDVSKVLVLVLILVAFGFLIRFEMNSRKNSKAAQAGKKEAESPR
jgi:hypothetical protein